MWPSAMHIIVKSTETESAVGEPKCLTTEHLPEQL